MHAVYHEQQSCRRCGLHAVNNLLQLQPQHVGYLSVAEANSIAESLFHEDCVASRAVSQQGRQPAGLAQCAYWVRLVLEPCLTPYRSAFPCFSGDYDIQVLAEALRRRRCEFVGHWMASPAAFTESMENLQRGLEELILHRQRQKGSDIKFCGLIVNRPACLGGRHWYALLSPNMNASATWIFSDSIKPSPVPLMQAETAGHDRSASMEIEAVTGHLQQQLADSRRCAPVCGWTRVWHVFAVAKAASSEADDPTLGTM
mmetsp:Transcript_20104/g.36377  ORF Transcript_20104/g.36377 Transcript_20104/m.36377 type:complete len:258 (+) Transcript_20104:56-829(+)